MIKKSVSFSVILAILVCALSCSFAFAADSLELTAVYGSTLNEVQLPDGYTWANASPEKIEVGNVGENTFKATHAVEGGTETVDVTVVVSPAYFSDVSIVTDGNKYYTGNPIEPEVRVFFNGAELVENVDYKVTYENNVDIGIAKAVVEGIGNFRGKSTVTFNIQRINVEEVVLSEHELELMPQDTFILDATIYPVNATLKDVVWNSSDERIATVDQNGKVTAIRNGDVEITVTTKDGGISDSCLVTVVTHVTNLVLSDGSLHLPFGEEHQLKYVILPDDAVDQNVNWISSDEDVVTVDENGLVKAVGKGTAIITVVSVDGELSDSCEVTVHSNLKYIFNQIAEFFRHILSLLNFS